MGDVQFDVSDTPEHLPPIDVTPRDERTTALLEPLDRPRSSRPAAVRLRESSAVDSGPTVVVEPSDSMRPTDLIEPLARPADLDVEPSTSTRPTEAIDPTQLAGPEASGASGNVDRVAVDRGVVPLALRDADRRKQIGRRALVAVSAGACVALLTIVGAASWVADSPVRASARAAPAAFATPVASTSSSQPMVFGAPVEPFVVAPVEPFVVAPSQPPSLTASSELATEKSKTTRRHRDKARRKHRRR